MTYIVLDMEWSQPMCKEKTLVNQNGTLPVEIIQIGAVMVKDGEILPEKFSEYIKPVCYRVIKSRIRKLTGISEKELKQADKFKRVMARFKEWCEKYGGEIITTWGADDVPNLKAQCGFFKYDSSWIPGWFNLQPLVTRQLGIDRAQINLNSAVELMGISQELQYHSAINDAMYTALILQQVKNIEEGIKWQEKVDFAHKNPYIMLRQKIYGKRKYSRVLSAVRSSELRRYVCPLCGRPSSLKDRLVNIKPLCYQAIIKCPKHTMQVNVIISKDENGKYSWVKEITPAGRETEIRYASLLEKKSDTEGMNE